MSHSVYSDLDKDLTIQRDGNVKILYDEDAIIQSVKTIMATISGERVRSPFGGSLISLLFRPMDEYLEDDLQRQITRIITEYEPRVIVRNVLVYARPNDNVIDVQINLRVKKIDRPITFNTKLRSFSS